jgi:hypothetical protein
METIIAALISGIATVVAAWISKGRSQKPESVPSGKEQPEETKKSVGSPGLNPNTTWWWVITGLFTILVIYAGFFMHQDLPSQMGLFVIPVVVVILSLIKPTRPWSAAAFVFGVSTIAFLTEFAVKLTRGESVTLSGNDRWLPFWILLISSGYAALAALICWWKRKNRS